MPDYRRMRVPGGCYFFTVNLLNRQSTLLVDHVAHLRRVVAIEQAARPFQIDAMVILPDHLHAIWTLPVGDTDYSTRWNRIKGEFSRGIPATESASKSRRNRRERGIWQRRFWEHAIEGPDDFNHHVDYCHYNPVKHGYVDRPIDWKYSSLHRYVKMGILEPNWASSEAPPDFDWA